MPGFKKIERGAFPLNPFTAFSEDWALLAAGTEGGGFNAMTASWGGFGHVWGVDAAFVFVRPSRYTHGFFEKNGAFTVTFLKEGRREALNVMGTRSGRDGDKARAAGLTPVFLEGAPTFAEARLVAVCKKLYSQDFAPDRLPPEVASKCYPHGDIHRQYIGQVLSVYANEGE
jgi:flavin reductase (DIM6/NTAB) family NADH-FMN oxidoreductase RutF